MSLVGKTCLITGASRGIGAAIAKCFAAEGASCILTGRGEGRLEVARRSLSAGRDETQRHRFLVGDVAQRAWWMDVVKQEKEIDILVNAAGTAHYSLLVATQEEQIERVLQTNLMGTIWACQIVAKSMMRRKKGCIVNISSLLGVKGGKGSAAYAASKAGILGLTRSLSAELGPSNIRVNAILPGYIDTKMTEGMTAEARSQALAQTPLKRFGTPEEVADAALFLVNNEFANNCVLNLDGGLSAT